MSLAFGVFDHLDASGAPLRDFYEDRLKLVELYDRLGFYCYHVAEHHSTPLGMAPSPSVFLSAVAQRTKRLNFGPLVYTLPLYHPIRLIEEICMLDQMSGGRFQFGTGKGISPIETRYYGLDPDNSAKMMIEAFEVLMRGLQNRTLDYEGEFYNFKNVPMEVEPLQKPHPPLWYGAGTPQSAERPAAHRHEHRHQRAGRDRAHADRALLEALQRRRREPPKAGFTRHLVIADTDEAALAIARRGYRRWQASFMKLWLDHGTRPVGVVYPAEFDGEGRTAAPSRARRTPCCANCRRRSMSRARTTCCAAWRSATSRSTKSRRSIELFAEHVMPRLRAKQPIAAE